jgi:hypothetical protein
MVAGGDGGLGSAPAEIVDVGNYRASRLNALKHGVLSRHLLLPWEEPAEYRPC